MKTKFVEKYKNNLVHNIFSLIVFIIFILLIFVKNNIFAEGYTYDDLYYEIVVDGIGPAPDFYEGRGKRVIIDKNGNKILNLNSEEEMAVMKDLYTGEPKLLIKMADMRNSSQSKKKNEFYNYDPIYEVYNDNRENIIEKSAPYWWYHNDMYKNNLYGILKATKVRLYDLDGNDTSIEFELGYGENISSRIFVLEDIVLYIANNFIDRELYYYNLQTKEKRFLGNYSVIDVYNDMIIAYSQGQNVAKSNVGFFTKDMKLIKNFNGYEKIDYINIDNKKYYVLTYNKPVISNINETSLKDFYISTKFIRYANFIDENLEFVFSKDIFIDYEDVQYNFDYEKIFNEEYEKNNLNFGPHNTLININEINCIIELKDEKLYMISDEKGYAICDENKKIIGEYFEKPIYIHNVANAKEKLIFSYLTDDISYFIHDYEYYDGDNEDKDKFYKDVDVLLKKDSIFEITINETTLTRQYFHIVNDKIVYLNNVEDMVLVPLNIDGFYFYHRIYGNNGFSYLRKNKNNLKMYEKKVFDLEGNVYSLNINLYYQTRVLKTNNKYFLFPLYSMSYAFDYESELFDFFGNSVLPSGKYIVLSGNLLKVSDEEICLYDDNLDIIKEISINGEQSVNFKYGYIILEDYKTKENTVYNKNLERVYDIDSFPYNFFNINISPYRVIKNDTAIWNKQITYKSDNYKIEKNNEGKYDLIDNRTKENILTNFKYLEFFNENYVIYKYGFKFGLMGYDGKKLCEYSIFDFLDD